MAANSNLELRDAVLRQGPLRQRHGGRLQLEEEVAAQLGEARVDLGRHLEELLACEIQVSLPMSNYAN